VPFWDYDLQQGIWKQQGTARLKGEFYEATVQHFSATNVAVAANDAACMRLHYDPGTVNFPFQLRITIPLASGADTTVTSTVTSSATDVIAGLPPKEPITLQIDALDASKQTVNSGAATPGPANPNPPRAHAHLTHTSWSRRRMRSASIPTTFCSRPEGS